MCLVYQKYTTRGRDVRQQGTATVRQDFINGKASGAGMIVTASRSAMLDEAAIQALQGISLKSTGTPEQPDVKKYLVKVEFARDSVTNLGKKTCADLTGDIAYFRASQPGVELNKMRVYEMTLGMMVIGGNMSDTAYVQRVSRAMPPGFAATAAQCERTPQALYLKVLAKEFKKSAIRGQPGGTRPARVLVMPCVVLAMRLSCRAGVDQFCAGVDVTKVR